ncbi:MAG: peptidylprolyl isomerase [Rhodospirillaceae bacterium]|nr:peptidylprolyl isomerase [Rhodospirillaceae bacterium]
MNKFTAFLVAICIGAFTMADEAVSAEIKDPENTLFLDLKDGRVAIELFPEVAPEHVARFKELTREGFFDGLTFHRVIDGFMAQTGDPRGDGTGGSGQNLPAEFSDKLRFEEGTLGAARSQDINSADSQFFIMLDRAPHLNGGYTIFGQVIDGMNWVHQIKKGSKRYNGEIEGDPDIIVRMQVAADAE